MKIQMRLISKAAALKHRPPTAVIVEVARFDIDSLAAQLPPCSKEQLLQGRIGDGIAQHRATHDDGSPREPLL